MVSTTVALGVTTATLIVFSALGVWFSRGRVDSVEDFISARNTTGRGMTTATLVASGMGAWILFSPAEAGAAFGGITAVIGYAIGSALPMLAFAFMGPHIRSLIPEGHSLTEYAMARYGNTMYAFVLIVSVFYMFIFLAAEMTGIASALSLVADVPGWQTAALIGLFVLFYTTYGGLKASIFTDTVQTLVILPLLVVGFVGALLSLGGTGEIYDATVASNASLLDPGFGPGLAFGFTVALAILGAELLNQAWWQRIYAARDARTVTRSFLVAAITVVPMIFLAGLFGLAATGLGLVDGNASIAFFLVLDAAFPEWVTLIVVVLAVLLVMSTADTLFNALSSVVTADVPRLVNVSEPSTLTTLARVLTILVALIATFVGAQGYSVLTLFLVADLLTAASFIPLYSGLFSDRVTGTVALTAGVLGIAVGAAYFPLTATAPGLSTVASVLPGVASLFNSFVSATAVSGIVTTVGAGVTSATYDRTRLARDIRVLDAERAATDGGDDR